MRQCRERMVLTNRCFENVVELMECLSCALRKKNVIEIFFVVVCLVACLFLIFNEYFSYGDFCHPFPAT